MVAMDEANKDLWKQISETNDIRYCFNCGTCITGCPASQANPPLLIRNLVRKVLLGLEDDLLDEDTPWMCVTCSKCEEMCPMDVRPFEICLQIRKWQCKNDETRIPPSVTEVYCRGYTQAVEKAQKLRKSVGITEPLPTISEFPQLLKQFQEMLMEIEIIKENAYMFGS